jgi:hypothetical protein
MRIFSFLNIKRALNQKNLFDLFPTKVAMNKPMSLFTDIVRREEHMRADLVCKRLYGTTELIEEFLKVNNIFNNWSVYENDEIVYFMNEDKNKLYYQEPVDNKKIISDLVNSKKNTQKDPNRSSPPSINSNGKSQLEVNKTNKTIKIIDSFE